MYHVNQVSSKIIDSGGLKYIDRVTSQGQQKLQQRISLSGIDSEITRVKLLKTAQQNLQLPRHALHSRLALILAHCRSISWAIVP